MGPRTKATPTATPTIPKEWVNTDGSSGLWASSDIMLMQIRNVHWVKPCNACDTNRVSTVGKMTYKKNDTADPRSEYSSIYFLPIESDSRPKNGCMKNFRKPSKVAAAPCKTAAREASFPVIVKIMLGRTGITTANAKTSKKSTKQMRPVTVYKDENIFQ